MNKGILQWVRTHYTKIANSIAFYPAIIAICFLFLSWVMLKIDFSVWGKHFKQQLSWLSLKDASTARTIVSTITAGILSLTVFSFSMVMIVLNQAASQMSNRVLTSMIENRFQQIVLGFYIGTIVYALFLLSTIRNIQSGIYVPAISIYLLILLTVINIFLFIYFLDYVTQTVKFETVIERVKQQTLHTMKKQYCNHSEDIITTLNSEQPVTKVYNKQSGYYQDFDKKQLMKIAKEEDIFFVFQQQTGTYLIEHSCLLLLYGKAAISSELEKKLLLAVDFFNGQPVDRNADYGFKHLAEVAIKALSPGINDPATAVLSINALSSLFAYRLYHCMPAVIKDEEGKPRIFIKPSSFKELFENCMLPIWDYGKNDRYIQNAMLHMLQQLRVADIEKKQEPVLNKLMNKVKAQTENNQD